MEKGKQHPPKVGEGSAADENRRTEKIELVEKPGFGSTLTLTEAAANLLGGGEEDHRATLVLIAGPTPGQVYSLGSSTVIGRDPATDIHIEDSAVSRRHARVFVRDGVHLIEDLGSANGTYVGGSKISRQELASGERIHIGPRVVLRFALFDETEEAMHRRLFESSTRDALTGVHNKKYLTERLGAEVAHALRHRSSLEIIMFDLDLFKQVNEQHGHVIGDAVLRALATCVQSVIRSDDVLGRFGGEEFMVITRNSDAATLAERIRVAVEQLTIPTERGLLSITISLGVVRIDEIGPRATATMSIEKADQRLLKAKRAGRNRVCAD